MDFNQLLRVKRQRWQRSATFFIAGLILFSFGYLMVGEVFISPFAEWSALDQQLVMQLRLPRLLAAVAIGASLAVSGAVLQVLLGNVLAEPGVLGISGGASLAMVLVLFFLPWAATPVGFMLAAVMGSLVFTLLLVSMAKAMKLTTTRLLLVGVALGILSGAVVTWAFYFSDNLSLRQLMYWLMGSIGGATWYQHTLTIMLIPFVLWLCCQGNVLDKLMLGELHAKQLGVDVNAIRWKLILAVSVLVGGAVALGGVIGFVGLVVPHLLRLALGTENRYLIPLSALFGALLLVIADLVARTALNAAELPLGVVTTTIGAPVFIWMLVRNHDA
ncbi:MULTISPECIES: vitamin B12 ABC transporter permease BtuC [unclassified Vibrio]|uniref:vitamin B12 ABC transporter permease BtuC n=1 Tax=unclassified Vibrio TaxID=2614977 RepID=UPI001360FECE|nr:MULTISPECIES: vitamin B12 ABC transporter permease BtuC [unclassified Vibrio]NAW58692.1 vitamin B12 ABC transporter permease BtuC [Vibrio sp. V36_P2S2PM302]NAX22606.1 vitamin B12 ABC transporter permease BtuC [Vibrio sp. V39_P1S14PM300]NAX25139.1 vitamin B12 ABC transporter permease BtuC [Vibrio sp. V38_P2S17PM301]NAX31593.1 vitamin B12 ABC transporter permease BtuC [Vibrio sp. V37_P2S8PM304]